MKLRQYVGPFAANDNITVAADASYRYIHIGIQIPYREPIAIAPTTRALATDLTINGTHYRVNDKCILEFDDMRETSFDISFDRDLPWGSIIDIAYENTGL